MIRLKDLCILESKEALASIPLCGRDDADVDGAGCLYVGVLCDGIYVSKK